LKFTFNDQDVDTSKLGVEKIPYFMILRQEAPSLNVSVVSNECYSSDITICRQECRSTKYNNSSVQYYSSDFKESATMPWRNIIMNSDQTKISKFSYGLNYMCTCDSMMSTEIVTDDNVNKVTRPAD
jgi:hypothetical protein